MSAGRQLNLQRLLNPGQIAIIGGRDAEVALRACQRIGYKGRVWPVNPKRKTLAGLVCYPSVEDLPQAPDAVFLAVPPKAALDVTSRLSRMQAGGIVCYTAGFSERGGEGGDSDRPLVNAAGDLAVIGPNCYGLINYIDKVSLWPFAHGGYCPGFGAAIITQSGMLSSDITMNQRSVPLSFMISAGNQSILKIEDFIDVLSQRDDVRSIGLHIEGLKDVAGFSRAAYRALEHNKPIVVLKTGTSKIGSSLTQSHTGSLSGTEEVYQALFKRLGIISVTHPAQLLETLKFVSICKVPAGNRLLGITCSGGGATMLADYAERIGLDFPQPGSTASQDIRSKLPSIAKVSNPLDYTTPIWGQPDKVYPVFQAALAESYDAAVMLQDYPLEEINESKEYYLNDAGCFIKATVNARLPAAVCSTLAENIDLQTREHLIESGVAPLQGIHEALDAIKHSIWYGKQRASCLQRNATTLFNTCVRPDISQLDEWQSKQMLKNSGFAVPPGALTDDIAASQKAGELGFPIVLKVNSDQIAHKTEYGAICLGLTGRNEVERAVSNMKSDLSQYNTDLAIDSFILEKLMDRPAVELMVSLRQDDQFGLIMTLASGGIFVELLADAVTLILPVTDNEILETLNMLRVAPMLSGYRGQKPVDKQMLVDTIQKLSEFMVENIDRVAELEINPLFVYSEHTCVVDVLMHKYLETELGQKLETGTGKLGQN